MSSTDSRSLVFIIVLLILFSCSSNETGQEKEFREIVEGFPAVELPLQLDHSGTAAKKYTSLQSENATRFVNDFNQKRKSDVWFWGRIYPSDRFHYLIGSMPADVVIPIIYVFDKTGEVIDSEIVVSGFGVGPEGYGRSNGYVRADKSFKTIDSLFYHTYIEELDSIVAGSGICTAIVSEFKIGDNGIIEMLKSDSVKTRIPD